MGATTGAGAGGVIVVFGGLFSAFSLVRRLVEGREVRAVCFDLPMVVDIGAS